MPPKIDFDEINKVVKLLEDRNLSEFEIEVEGFKLKIGRSPKAVPAPVAILPAAPLPGPAAAGDHSARAAEAGAEARGDAHFVTSPIVGTFYRAPSPSSPPFVDIGEPVKKGQTLCIVEAMKLMNEIECDVDGVIKEIFVENGKPVEFGQKLFSVVPGA